MNLGHPDSGENVVRAGNNSGDTGDKHTGEHALNHRIYNLSKIWSHAVYKAGDQSGTCKGKRQRRNSAENTADTDEPRSNHGSSVNYVIAGHSSSVKSKEEQSSVRIYRSVYGNEGNNHCHNENEYKRGDCSAACELFGTKHLSEELCAYKQQNGDDSGCDRCHNDADGIHYSCIRIKNGCLLKRCLVNVIGRLNGIALPKADNCDQHKDPRKNSRKLTGEDRNSLSYEHYRKADREDQEDYGMQISRKHALGFSLSRRDLFFLLCYCKLMSAMFAEQLSLLQGMTALSTIHKI